MAIKPVEILIKAKDEASSVFGLLKRNAVELGVTIAGYFGIKTFVGAVQGAASLEAKLSEVRAVAGATAEDMALLRKAAEDAGATTKFSAEEGADALGNLARAGLSAQQAITALPATLQLAQAGQIGLAESAEIVTRTIAGFNLEAADAGRIADVLAQGANASNTSVLGLGQALSYAAPTAVSLGLSLETTVAIIGKFADAGIDASRAGTALNAILSQFSDPASRFRKELAAMGITTNDFESALRQMAAAGPGSQKAVLAVGTEAGPALRALLNQGIGALDELKGKLNESSGSAAAFAAIVEDNLNGSVNNLGSAWDTVKLALATPVLPVLKDGVQQLTAALRGAVENGTIGRFGDAIAKGFQAALEWGQRFAAEVDIEALVTRVSNAADQAGRAFDTVGEYARNAGNLVQLSWGVMAAGANTVLTGIYAIGTAFAATAASIVKGAALASEALAKIAITDSAKNKLLADAAAMRDVLAGLEGVTKEFATAANDAMQGVAENAQLARDGWSGLTEDTQAAAGAASTGTAAFETMATALQEVGASAAQAGQQTRAELEKTATTARATAAEVAGAFERMGIQSKDQLKQAADNAQRDFGLIKDSGQATATGLQQAFRAYAEAAIAANGGVATDALRSQAAMQGLEITTDAAGKTIVRAMNDAAEATRGAGRSADGAAGSYRNMQQSAEAAAAAAAVAAKYSSPLGPDKYSKPKGGSVTGNTREERLAGQNAVDNSLQFTLRDKLNAGDLTADDLASLQAVVAALKQREQVDRDVDRMAPGAFSLEGMRDRRSWEQTRLQFENAISRLGGGGGASVGRTVRVDINTSRGTETVNTDDAGAAAIVRSLQAASLAAGK